MRFDALHLQAFGPFTGLRLDFPAGKADLHLIHGANEAGKSSLLRGIGDLLFEIPSRSTDNFLHSHKDMRISADLRSRDGRALSIQRRKGNRNTLLDAEGAPLLDETLGSWLGHVDRDYFTTMFGLASEQLRAGAAALLRGEGDLGKALFSASLGGTPVHKVMEALTEDARPLFAGRARSRIRASAAAYADEMKLIREDLIKPEDWDAVEQSLLEAKTQQAQIEHQRQEILQRLQWIQRCLDALPTLAKWQAREHELAQLATVAQVPSSFAAEARAALSLRKQAEADLQHCNNELARLESLLGQCKPREDVLAREVEIESLHRGTGVYGDQRKRLAARSSELAALESLLSAGMKDLGAEGEIASLDKLRLSAADFATLKEAASALTSTTAKLEANQTALREKDAALRALQSRLGQFTQSDVSRLREALALAGAAAEAHRTLDVAEAEAARALRELRSQQRLLTNAPDDLAAISSLPLPAKATAAAMQAEHEQLQQDLKQVAKEHSDAQALDARLRRELKQIQAGTSLPSLQELLDVREQREAIWQQLVKAGAGGDTPAFNSLVPQHEQIQARGDGMADHLRDHADQVAKAEERRALIAENAQYLEDLEQRVASRKQALADWQSRWNGIWTPAGLLPGSPAEMLEWREHWQEFCRRYDRWCSATDDLERRTALIATAEKTLSQALRTEVRPFAVLHDEARRAIAKSDKDEGARSALAQQFDDATNHREQFAADEARLKAAQAQALEAWQKKCRELRMDADAGPAVAMQVIEQRRELVTRFDAWQGFVSERDALREQMAAFEREAQELTISLGFDKGAAEAVAATLWRELETAREARSTQTRLVAEKESVTLKLTDTRRAHAAAADHFQALLAQAALESEAALEPLLAQLETHTRLANERDHLRESLTALARGEALDVFTSRVQAESPEQLGLEQTKLELEISELNAKRDEAIKTTVEATQRQSALRQAGDAAAMHRQAAENHAAALRADAARYLRLRLATHFLEQQIDRFRQENQAPLMKRASALFQAVTLGSFEGLATDFIDDQPVIVGQRQNQSVPVTGMSEGTRDQLYLSLRLAAIERHIDAHEPLPLVLDDLLMTFDDQRAAAILPVLAELSKKTQILLFTHHRHLVDLMQKTLAPGEFTTHELAC